MVMQRPCHGVPNVDKPMEIDDATMAFPVSVDTLMPKYSEIPDEFKRWPGGPYCKWMSKWFFSGLQREETPAAKEGIDQAAALRHLSAIMRSFQPKQEHKEAAVAYLASLWLETPQVA